MHLDWGLIINSKNQLPAANSVSGSQVNQLFDELLPPRKVAKTFTTNNVNVKRAWLIVKVIILWNSPAPNVDAPNNENNSNNVGSSIGISWKLVYESPSCGHALKI
ncbi:hypothetical protein ACLKA6_008846 [Drosophila palustris]